MREFINLFENCGSCEDETIMEAGPGTLTKLDPALLAKAKKSPLFRDKIGDQSVISSKFIHARGVAGAIRDLLDNPEKYIGVVIGRQVAGDIVQDFIVVDHENIVTRVYSSGDLPADVESVFIDANVKNWKQLYSFLNKMNQTESYANRLSIMPIEKDLARADVRAERASNKPAPRFAKGQKGYDRFVQSLRSALRARLDGFKKANAKGVSSTDELIDFIKQNGFMDKIKVGDYVYEQNGTTGSFDKMIKGQGQDDSWYEFVMRYRVPYEDLRNVVVIPKEIQIKIGQISPGVFGPLAVKFGN